MAPASATAQRKWWHELQRLAGVTSMDGRGWYGLRRLGADDAEDVTKDARVLNRLGGWKHSVTREGYQDPTARKFLRKRRGFGRPSGHS